MAIEKQHLSLDFQKTAEIQNAIIQVLASAPSLPNEGQIYYNSTDKTAYIYNSSAWVDLGRYWDEFLTSSGTRIGANLSVGIGDYDLSGNGVRLLLSDATNQVDLYGVSTNLHATNLGAPNVTNTAITTLGAKALITKEYGDANYGGGDLSTTDINTLAKLNAIVADATLVDIGHTHLLAAGATDVTATASELNLLDLSGLTAGWALLADTATTASWQAIPAGATTFVGLTDVGEPDYVGHAGNLIRVNATPNGLEFVDGSTLYVAAGITTLAGYGISDTMANFDTAVSDGTIVWAGDTSTSGWGFVIDDDTMATASATNLASAESVKTYIDNSVAGGLVYKGGYNASTNTPDLDTVPSGVLAGDTYTVTAAGTFFSTGVQVGDVLIAEIASASVEADWTIVNKNIPDIVSASESAEGIIELATQGEVDTGTDTLKAVTPATLKGTLGTTGTLSSALVYTELIGDNASTTIAVTHSIGRQHVISQVFEVADGMTRIRCEVENTSTTVTTFKFNTAPTTDQFRVVITG